MKTTSTYVCGWVLAPSLMARTQTWERNKFMGKRTYNGAIGKEQKNLGRTAGKHTHTHRAAEGKRQTQKTTPCVLEGMGITKKIGKAESKMRLSSHE